MPTPGIQRGIHWGYIPERGRDAAYYGLEDLVEAMVEE